MEREVDLGPPDCHDATDLICGLIRELSSLKLVLFSLFYTNSFSFLFFFTLSPFLVPLSDLPQHPTPAPPSSVS